MHVWCNNIIIGNMINTVYSGYTSILTFTPLGINNLVQLGLGELVIQYNYYVRDRGRKILAIGKSSLHLTNDAASCYIMQQLCTACIHESCMFWISTEFFSGGATSRG